MKLPIVQLSPFSRYFIPLRSKYSLQHPVLIKETKNLFCHTDAVRLHSLKGSLMNSELEIVSKKAFAT
jgi:hypothetical protein